jgi:group I intron endonuclease
MTPNSGVYKIANKENGKMYIGSAFDIDKRFNLHKSCLRRNIHHSVYLQNSWNKYGEDCFEFSIMEYCDISILKEREQFYINNFCPQYNMKNVVNEHHFLRQPTSADMRAAQGLLQVPYRGRAA